MNQTLNGEEQVGYELVREVLQEPLKRILKNGNREEKIQEVLGSISKNYGIGYNAVTDTVSNLLTDGVIDSKKSIRIALESATERAVQQFNIGVIVTFPQNIEI